MDQGLLQTINGVGPVVSRQILSLIHDQDFTKASVGWISPIVTHLMYNLNIQRYIMPCLHYLLEFNKSNATLRQTLIYSKFFN